MRLIQLSDTHLSRARPFFHFNFELALREIAAAPPDLVVVSGDLALNGADDADDLVFAREQLDRLPVPWLAIPGNHDVGLAPPEAQLSQPTTEARIARYLDVFGEDRFAHDLGDWRLIGVNSQLMASGLAREADQWCWLADQLRAAAGRPVLLFLHVPLFIDSPIEGAAGFSCLRPAPRRRLQSLIRGHGGVRAVACGHLHRAKTIDVDGVTYQWCPSTAFIVGDERLMPYGGTSVTGFLDWSLEPDAATVRLVEPALMLDIDVRRWVQPAGGYARAAVTDVPVMPGAAPTGPSSEPERKNR